MMEITLRLRDGQKKTFSEQELVAIVEEHLQNQNSQTKKETTEFVPVPTEGKWFKVDPLSIDQSLFKEKREDSKQEETRQYILEAFEEMKKYPQRYARSFKTMMPQKKWSSKKVGELKEFASMLGDHNADWVEQALEWAQRIDNGEWWEDICNKVDTANWYRLVVWKNGYARLVGDSHVGGSNKYPACDVGERRFYDSEDNNHTVPLVVFYE